MTLRRMRMFRGGFLAIIFASATLCLSAGQPANNRVKRIAEGILEIGAVRLDQKNSTISFQAAVNMTNGVVEYLLVNSVGKLHESILKTSVDASDLNVAALLLGVKGAQTNQTAGYFDANEIPGERVVIRAAWESGAGERKVRAEELVFNVKAKLPMTRGPWTYNGSQTLDGTFIASRDGSIVSLISDPFALINNPRPGRQNDEIWFVNTNAVPALNTPVKITLQFNTTVSK